MCYTKERNDAVVMETHWAPESTMYNATIKSDTVSYQAQIII